MNRQDLYRHVGSIQQVAKVRPLTYAEGRAENLKAFEVKNGALQFTVLGDKCLDLGDVSFKGINVNFLAKPGLMGRNHFDTHGDEALRSIMGGMMFTAGLENICPPCTSDGKDYPMHGRIRTTPAEHLCADAQWTEEGYTMTVSGEMREAELFGENMVLRRKISTTYPGNTIVVEDEIENQGFREEPMMILYHCNLGWPLLSEDCEIVLPTLEVIPRDEDARKYLESYDRMEKPVDNEPEAVFLHRLAGDEEGNTFAAVINEKLGIGVKISFSKKELPYFMEWKTLASGDYALGLEPANSSVYGRLYHEDRGDLHKMKPFEKECKKLVFTFLEGKEELDRVREEAGRLIGK
ncbi:MAG: aldose 1-epimerase family protein [Clostridiales bacterium]|nr:aldose 1-epimerase family protein [Clostridiales bacterium]